MRLRQALESIHGANALEAAIADAVSHFDEDCMGHRGSKIDIGLVRHTLLVHVSRTRPCPPDERLATDSAHARGLLRQRHIALFEHGREALVQAVARLCQTAVTEVFTDVASAPPGYVLVFTLASDLEARLQP